MDRKWKSGAAGAPPTLDNVSDGYATAGNPGTGTPATKPGPHWYHMVTEELLSVITAFGITFDKTVVTQLRDAIYGLIRGTTQTITSTGTQNDYAVTAARRLTLRCNNASLLTLTGFAAGQDGDEIEILSVGAGQVDLSHQASGSSAANRVINFATSCVTSLAAASGTARVRYDGTTQRWRLVHHEQGAYIASSVTTNSPNGGGTVASTFTVNRYKLIGRQLHWNIYVAFTPTGTVTSVDVNLPIANATLAADGYNTMHAESAATPNMCRTKGVGAGTNVNFGYANGAGAGVNFGAGTNGFLGNPIFELS